MSPELEQQVRKLAADHVRLHGAWTPGGEAEAEHIDLVARRALATLAGDQEPPYTHSHASSEFGLCTECDAAAVLQRLGEEHPG